MENLIGFIAIILIIGTFFYLDQREKKRVIALGKLANQLGFEFIKNPEMDFQSSFNSFKLFSRGRFKKIKNAMHHSKEGIDCHLFNYSYTKGTGKNSRSYKQTVMSFSCEDYCFPNFDLSPETFMHKIGQAFGYQDINFKNKSDFSSSFLLRGDDEEKIRLLFTDDLLDYFVENKEINVEVRGSKMIMYILEKRVEPEQFKKTFDDYKSLFINFCDSLAKI